MSDNKFKLCLGCWKSKSEERFYFDAGRNTHQRMCILCYKGKVKHPEKAYYDFQKSKPEQSRYKICNYCFEEKRIDLFYASKSGRLGRLGECAPCMNSKVDKKKATTRAAAWNKNNPERRKEIVNRYDKSDQGKLRKRINEQKRRTGKISIYSDLSDNYWNELLEYYGAKCMRCGSTEDLSHDHIIPISWGFISSHTYLNSQILCKSCNTSKLNRSSIDFRPVSIETYGFEENDLTIDIFEMIGEM